MKVQANSPTRFGAFLARHTLALTLIGSAGTLASFMSKDIFQETLKSSTDDINAALSAYDISESKYTQEYFLRARREFEQVDKDNRKLATDPPEHTFALDGPLLTHLDILRDNLVELNERIGVFTALVNSIPCEARGKGFQTDAPRLQGKRADCGDTKLDRSRRYLTSDAKLVDAGFDDAKTPILRRGGDLSKRLDRANEIIAEAGQNCFRTHQNLFSEGRTAKELAKEYVESRNKIANRFRWFVAALFVLGWTLGLVGSLFGVHTAGTE